MTAADYIPPGRLDPADPDYAHKSEVRSFARIAELQFKPLPGDYDAAHLKAFHRHLFQDSPDRHAPGQYRPAGDSHIKLRKLEGPAGEYVVRYAPMRDELDADNRINAVAAEIHPDKLRGLPVEAFAERLAKAYAQLDHIHPFQEGNSRTLRAFTAQASREAGLELDWGTTNATAQTRNALYLARDKEVLALTSIASLPGEREMMAHARASHFVKASMGRDGSDLRALVEQSTTRPDPARSRAEAFASLPADAALKRFPDLAPAFAALDAVRGKFDAEGLTGDARRQAEDTARQYITDKILHDRLPAMPPPVKLRNDPDRGPER